MTREEYRKECEAIKAESVSLAKRKDAAVRDYISSNTDQSLIDKRIVVTFKDRAGAAHEVVCWLGGYELRFQYGEEIVPILFKDKKTGGRSLQRLYINSKIHNIRLADSKE